MKTVPRIRVTACNQREIRAGGEYVLYWMIAARRTRYNFALDRALEWSRRLGKPLVILEALRRGFRWETERTRQFIVDGMAENWRALRGKPVLYYPYLEPKSGAGKGLLQALAARASIVITDEFPCFFLPAMVAVAASRLDVLLEQVDSSGVLPLRAAPKEFTTAHSFRRFLQKELPNHLGNFPDANPWPGAKIPVIRTLLDSVTRRWPRVEWNEEETRASSRRPTGAAPAPLPGGSSAAQHMFANFLRAKLAAYPEERNEPSADATSDLSPYLHFGHISAHEIFAALSKAEKWSSERVALRPTGSRAGWWGMSAAAEEFLDQFITWRELGFNCCAFREDYDRFESLPEWARKTLTKHKSDQREFRYTPRQFADASTHDPIWNAAQTQLLREGRIHNYTRMIWGKKILEWTRSPEEALAVMIELNNRYATDGRDPNSYSGIFWCLGRYDRPWGPERHIFGTVRYMSSQNTARKFDLSGYQRRYGPVNVAAGGRSGAAGSKSSRDSR